MLTAGVQVTESNVHHLRLFTLYVQSTRHRKIHYSRLYHEAVCGDEQQSSKWRLLLPKKSLTILLHELTTVTALQPSPPHEWDGETCFQGHILKSFI